LSALPEKTRRRENSPTRFPIPQSESDTNGTSRRVAWQENALDERTRTLLQRDSEAFLHQSVSTPCLNAIAKAEGIWIEDLAGRRYMDFHGNNVHHVGYGHPRVKRAIAEQMDALSFAPRRYACEPAVELAETLARIAPGGLSKVLFTTGGSDAVEVAVKIARLRLAATRRCPSGPLTTAPDSGPPRCRARSCSGPARRHRSSQARCTSRPSGATAAPTGRTAPRRAAMPALA
jgi:hypothetical protein